MGQPLRCRHDRADRFLLRLSGDGELRRAADARHRFSRIGNSIRQTARIAQIDIRAEALGRRAPVELGLPGRCRPHPAVIPATAESKYRSRPSRRRLNHYRNARKRLDALAYGRPAGSLHPQHIARAVSELASNDAIFTCDVGLPTVWAARYLAMNGRRRLIGSFWHGSMANALPQAIGAQATFPHRQVVSLSGDGGFSMLMGDLLSLVQLKFPVKVVVFNNGALGFVELEQKSTGFLNSGPISSIRTLLHLPRRSESRACASTDPAEVEASCARR